MIRKLDEENLTYAFPEVAFDNDYVIATYQAKVKTSNIEKLAMAISDEQTTGTWIKVGADSMEKTRRFRLEAGGPLRGAGRGLRLPVRRAPPCISFRWPTPWRISPTACPP